MLVYLVLEVGAPCGVPMRPDQLEQLMKVNETKIAHVARNENDDDT